MPAHSESREPAGQQIPAQSTPAAPSADAFTLRPTGVNQFHIYRGEVRMGRELSPTEGPVVLGWIRSITEAA